MSALSDAAKAARAGRQAAGKARAKTGMANREAAWRKASADLKQRQADERAFNEKTRKAKRRIASYRP